MKENLIMSTVYNVLMDEGYRPKSEKLCPEVTTLFFKSQGHPLTILSNGDDIIEIDAAVIMPYNKKFGRLDLYNFVSNFKCMQVADVEFQDNKKSLGFVLRFQSMVLNTNDVKGVLEWGISIITHCLEEIYNIN